MAINKIVISRVRYLSDHRGDDYGGYYDRQYLLLGTESAQWVSVFGNGSVLDTETAKRLLEICMITGIKKDWSYQMLDAINPPLHCAD